MSRGDFLFTSESVTEGHPDKVADNISDAILDAIIIQDKTCRVACETLVTTGLVLIAGEITTSTQVEMAMIARNTIRDIGYVDANMGFDYQTCAILTTIDKQSPDIAMGVNRCDGEQGAGDQGLMFGYACDQTPLLMPAPIYYAHGLTARLTQARRSGELPWLRPDGKSQVTMEYRNGKPFRVEAVVIAAQHSDDISTKGLRSAIMDEVIQKVFPAHLLDENTKYHINATGRFVIGGPMGDSGLTGRKIIVDTYGGWGRHGGGAFSGKDPSKVDRSASYMARHIAKNIVAAGLAHECEVQLAYAIGVAEPVSVKVDTFGTSQVEEDKLEAAVRKVFPLKPAKIIEYLDLLRPIFKATAAYGHFGREDEKNFTWERTHKVDELKAALA